tara:strand:+ start:66 stop:335 length:270 start_codon:yes stop_codon:yes gene_type:complete
MIDLLGLHRQYGTDIEFLNALFISGKIDSEYWEVASNELYARRMKVLEDMIAQGMNIYDLGGVEIRDSRKALELFMRNQRVKTIKRAKR